MANYMILKNLKHVPIFLWKWGQAIFLLFPSALLPFWFISATIHTIKIDKHIKLLSAFNFSPLIKYRNGYRFYQKIVKFQMEMKSKQEHIPMSFNRTKDKATLSFLQVSKYWDSSFDRESLLPWTWLANMQVSHLQTQPLVSNQILFLQAAPGRSPSSVAQFTHNAPWAACQHGCLCWVVPVLQVCFPRPPYNWLLTAHRPFPSRSAFITLVILYHQTLQNGLLALNIEECITCLYILNFYYFVSMRLSILSLLVHHFTPIL